MWLKVWEFIKKHFMNFVSIIILISGIAFFFSSGIIGCCSFSVERYDSIPEECNLAYNTMKLVSGKDTDKSLADDPMEWCQKALQEIRDDCTSLVYGKHGSIQKGEINKYIQFRKCMRDELKEIEK